MILSLAAVLIFGSSFNRFVINVTTNVHFSFSSVLPVDMLIVQSDGKITQWDISQPQVCTLLEFCMFSIIY